MNKDKLCWICGSDKYVDDHHFDCREGKFSPEIVPLCRRCHRTYHDWGIGAFSPDTTDKALEVENKRREILHLPPMKLEDVERSSYWYKKHNITPPSSIQSAKRKPVKLMPFRIPSNPLCGEDWLREHLTDHTPEEIGALTIEVSYDNKSLSPVAVADRKGTLRKIIKQHS